MVDTLVLGTSAKAWEFESLHAQIKGNGSRSFFYTKVLFVHRTLIQDCYSESSSLANDVGVGIPIYDSESITK